MKHLIYLALFIAGIFITFQDSSAADKKWTVIAYMAADNDLEEFIVADFIEMAAAGSNKNINIVVQLDRVPGYDAGYGDWETCHRFYIEKNMEPLESNAIKDWGDGLGGGREVDMGDGKTLSSFITWATKNYPAENYALILNDHGDGWKNRIDSLRKALESSTSEEERALLLDNIRRLEDMPYKALCWDNTTVNGTPIYVPELADALLESDATIDLLGFDACLMGMIEVAHQLYWSADIMVASEELIPGTGWDYTAIIGYLASSPNASAADLGKAIVKSYDKYYSGTKRTTYTLAAIDLYKFELLTGKVDELASSLMKNWNSDKVDIAEKAKEVILLMNKTILAKVHGASWENDAFGLSINFPTDGPQANYSNDNLDFVRDTNWDEFLTEYSKSMNNSWISDARQSMNTFGQDKITYPYVDLNKFCRLLGGASNFYLANGSVVSFEASDISPGLDNIERKAKIWVQYTDPVNKAKTGLKAPVKLVAKSNDSVNPIYYAEFKKDIKLFDAKKYKNATGSDLVGKMKISDHIADGLYASYKDTGGNLSIASTQLAATVYLANPIISSLEGKFVTGQPLLVKGYYFGSKIPQILIEIESIKDGKFKYVRCKPTKEGNYRFFDSSLVEGKSCMKVWETDGADTEGVGYSEVQVEYPKISSQYEPTGFVCLYNGAGKTALSVTYYHIAGRVKDQSGNPIPDIKIVLSGDKDATDNTTSYGSYWLNKLLSGNYTVTPQLEGYTFSPASRNIAVSINDVDDVDFIGTPSVAGTCTIAGWISASSENPDIDLSGITVELSNGGKSTITGSTGGYVFYELNEGNYTVTPSRDGYSFTPTNRSVSLAGPNASELQENFEASNGTAPPAKFKISGSVASEYVLTGCTLSLSNGQSVPIANDPTNGKANYEFINLDPGTYTLSGTCDGDFSWSLPGEIEIIDSDLIANIQVKNQDAQCYSLNITVSGLDPNDWIYLRTVFSLSTTSADSQGVVNSTWTKIPQGRLIVIPGSDNDKYIFSPSSQAAMISGDTSISFTATKK